jgi:hypothetical protein
MLPVLEEIFWYELQQHPSRREQLFKMVAHDRDIWQATEMHDLDLFNQMEEGEQYSFKRPKQGASKTLSILKYGLGFSISEEMVADGKFSVIGDMVKKLAKSGRESQEISAMNIFNNGFSSETAADAVAVFSASHTLPSGGTFRNILSTAADLSPTSLGTALSDYEQVFVGDSGIIYDMAPKVLLVHPDNKRYAMELTGSDLKPDSSDNNLNSVKGDGLSVVSSPHLSDTDAWFLLSSPESTGLRIVSRMPMETKAADPAVGFATDAILYKSRYREKIGVTHAKGIFGTPGA